MRAQRIGGSGSAPGTSGRGRTKGGVRGPGRDEGGMPGSSLGRFQNLPRGDFYCCHKSGCKTHDSKGGTSHSHRHGGRTLHVEWECRSPSRSTRSPSPSPPPPSRRGRGGRRRGRGRASRQRGPCREGKEETGQTGVLDTLCVPSNENAVVFLLLWQSRETVEGAMRRLREEGGEGTRLSTLQRLHERIQNHLHTVSSSPHPLGPEPRQALIQLCTGTVPLITGSQAPALPSVPICKGHAGAPSASQTLGPCPLWDSRGAQGAAGGSPASCGASLVYVQPSLPSSAPCPVAANAGRGPCSLQMSRGPCWSHQVFSPPSRGDQATRRCPVTGEVMEMVEHGVNSHFEVTQQGRDGVVIPTGVSAPDPQQSFTQETAILPPASRPLPSSLPPHVPNIQEHGRALPVLSQAPPERQRAPFATVDTELPGPSDSVLSPGRRARGRGNIRAVTTHAGVQLFLGTHDCKEDAGCAPTSVQTCHQRHAQQQPHSAHKSRLVPSLPIPPHRVVSPTGPAAQAPNPLSHPDNRYPPFSSVPPPGIPFSMTHAGENREQAEAVTHFPFQSPPRVSEESPNRAYPTNTPARFGWPSSHPPTQTDKPSAPNPPLHNHNTIPSLYSDPNYSPPPAVVHTTERRPEEHPNTQTPQPIHPETSLLPPPHNIKPSFKGTSDNREDLGHSQNRRRRMNHSENLYGPPLTSTEEGMDAIGHLERPSPSPLSQIENPAPHEQPSVDPHEHTGAEAFFTRPVSPPSNLPAAQSSAGPPVPLREAHHVSAASTVTSAAPLFSNSTRTAAERINEAAERKGGRGQGEQSGHLEEEAVASQRALSQPALRHSPAEALGREDNSRHSPKNEAVEALEREMSLEADRREDREVRLRLAVPPSSVGEDSRFSGPPLSGTFHHQQARPYTETGTEGESRQGGGLSWAPAGAPSASSYTQSRIPVEYQSPHNPVEIKTPPLYYSGGPSIMPSPSSPTSFAFIEEAPVAALAQKIRSRARESRAALRKALALGDEGQAAFWRLLPACFTPLPGTSTVPPPQREREKERCSAGEKGKQKAGVFPLRRHQRARKGTEGETVDSGQRGTEAAVSAFSPPLMKTGRNQIRLGRGEESVRRELQEAEDRWRHQRRLSALLRTEPPPLDEALLALSGDGEGEHSVLETPEPSTRGPWAQKRGTPALSETGSQDPGALRGSRISEGEHRRSVHGDKRNSISRPLPSSQPSVQSLGAAGSVGRLPSFRGVNERSDSGSGVVGRQTRQGESEDWDGEEEWEEGTEGVRSLNHRVGGEEEEEEDGYGREENFEVDTEVSDADSSWRDSGQTLEVKEQKSVKSNMHSFKEKRTFRSGFN
uniref:Uncharacterized protein n=1 Tax=Chromera velia CCMP2878 TaxID=1169474 RepID=A0A0G4HZ14_9ALVE|eukprot:Cvel_1558.t1-p1 / transcript=Cvel_1558.t1 / gene=Cvel_1558 / organism=Chromera_velia_CCMP2878 / gene_product=Pollen-specific leucine-rich repeat extensin-like, putative / transcript_product=Pollen-specific leucine-rich repeat extensin-like, putative / location=Cvel_scaffold55:72106-77147(+) / protein_length=1338 / sequence_SO=supercontig / SO=protein_coding / is_pseudo=false